MTRPSTDTVAFPDWEEADLESYLDARLAGAPGLVGMALIEITPPHRDGAEELIGEHLEGEDHAVRVGHSRFVIVRSPLVGPAEMEGLALRIADSFAVPEREGADQPGPPVHIGVVTGRRGDKAKTLLRHVSFGLTDAKTIGRSMVPVDDRR